MRLLKGLIIAALSITLLAIIGTARRQPRPGAIPLPSGIFQTCDTEIAPQPKAWEVTSINLDRSVRLIIMADVCRNSVLGTSSISGFHIVASHEPPDSLATMGPEELQQLLDANTLVDLDTTSFGQIRPTVVMLHDLPRGVVEYDVRDEATTRRDLGIQFACIQTCDPGKIRVRRRSALGADFFYVLFNPDPIQL